MIGRLVDVTASLDTVNVTHNGVNVTTHERECARALTVTHPNHVEQTGVLRRQFQTTDATDRKRRSPSSRRPAWRPTTPSSAWISARTWPTWT